MADKFPALEDMDDLPQDVEVDVDVKDTHADEDDFKKSFPSLDDEENELTENAFKEDFPALEEDTQTTTGNVVTADATEDSSTVDHLETSVKSLNLSESTAIKEWKERQQLEIERRDQQAETKRKETIEKAQKAIDDFYENYNSKRDEGVKSTQEAAQEFLESIDDTSSSSGTTWDRALKLIDDSDTGTKEGSRDKTRFREILLSLKGDVDAPGAAGY